MRLLRLELEPADAAVLVELLSEGRRRAAANCWLTADHHRLLEHLDALARTHRTGMSDRTSAPEPTATMEDMKNELTTRQAAAVLGCTVRHVVRLIDDNVLGARRVGVAWRVSEADVMSLKEADQ